jgi:DNA polymerase III sliding clamp (beta) subunit (PCNA family)
MIWEAGIKNIKLWKAIVSMLESLCDDVIFKVEEDMVKVQATDVGLVCIIEIQLLNRAFFNVKKEVSSISFKVDINLLHKITDRARDSDSLMLNYNSVNNELIVSIKTGKLLRVFDLKCLEITSEEEDDLETEFETTGYAMIEPEMYNTILKDAELFNDHYYINIGDGSIQFVVLGTDQKIKQSLLAKVEGTGVGAFRVDYSKKFAGLMSFSSLAKIELGDYQPIVFKFDLEDKNTIFGKSMLILAPQVINEEEKNEEKHYQVIKKEFSTIKNIEEATRKVGILD